MEERRKISGEGWQRPLTYHEAGIKVVCDMISFVASIVYSSMNSYNDERAS